MIQFETPLMADQFLSQLHPDCARVIGELDKAICNQFFKMEHGVKVSPPTKVTEVGRTDDDSEHIYTSVVTKLKASGGKGLGGLELNQYEQIKDLSEAGLKNWCRWRPSWHKPFCAVDVGGVHYTSAQFEFAKAWVNKQCPRPMWEIITESHGTGPHLHIARRDYTWLKDFPGSLRRAEGRTK